MKTCPNCSSQNIDDAKFCESCGKPITTPGPNNLFDNNTGTDGGTTLLLKIVSFILAPIGIILGIIYMNDPNPEKKAAGKTYLYLGIGGLVLQCLFWGGGYEQY